MTDQELFDRAAAHLLKQGKRSMRNSRGCAYRGKDGLKCAIGALIPDELYRPEMEGRSASRLASMYPELPFANNNQLLLDSLQMTHDFRPARSWRKALAGLAADHRLEFKPC